MEKHHVLIDSDLYEQHVDKTFNFQKKKKKKTVHAKQAIVGLMHSCNSYCTD